MVAVTEAFALGVAKGAAPTVLFDVISKASGNCWTLHTRCPASGVLPERPVNDGTRAVRGDEPPGLRTAGLPGRRDAAQANESMK